MKLVIRLVAHSAVMQIYYEICWQFTRHAVKHHGMHRACGCAFVAQKVASMAFYGRLMSGSVRASEHWREQTGASASRQA
jgi:hypothetical protein